MSFCKLILPFILTFLNAHFEVFFSRRCENVENFINTKFPFKNVLSLTIEYRMYLKFLQESCYLGWFKTSQALWSAVKETRLNSLRDNFVAKSSRLSTKMSLSSIVNFLFPFASFIGVFSIMKCKTLLLKTSTWWTRASHFVDGWHLLRCQNPLLPHPLWS